MRRTIPLILAVIAIAATSLSGVRADHLPTAGTPGGAPADAPTLQEGPVRFIANAALSGHSAAASFGENRSFTRDGREYLISSDTVFGLHVVDVTDALAPVVVSSYSSAVGCPGNYGVQSSAFDVFAPLGAWENDLASTPDGRIAVLGMDAGGRCHDGAMGGLELVDLTDLTNPRTLHLTRDVGEAHSVTVDPVRPWLAYLSSSDSADFIEVVDFKSCLGGVEEIDLCRPTIARAQLDPDHVPGVPVNPNDFRFDLATTGCHDIRFRGNRAYCAGLGYSAIIDTARVLGSDGQLTGSHLTSGPLACPVIPAQWAGDGVMVTDCSRWSETRFRETGQRSIAMRMLSHIDHDGSKPATLDIATAHQAETLADGKVMFVTDERGGGLTAFDQCPNGGAWFYDIRDEANPTLMVKPDGSPAGLFTDHNLPFRLSCTIHYGQQLGTENVIAFGWYLNGTRIYTYDIDYSVYPAVIDFDEVAAYAPAGGWTTQALPLVRNPADPDEVIVYTADLARGIDVLGVRIPRG